MQFHILSFEGPDPYSRVGGLGTRVEGLSQTLADHGFETHLWFVGAPALPGWETIGALHLHRWCQWISEHKPGGVYDGDAEKAADYSASLPPYLVEEVLLPHLRAGGRGEILAEEWQTVGAVLLLDELLTRAGVRHLVTILWNANNTYGFERIDWERLGRAAVITTVSRYMKHMMSAYAADAVVIPNGIAADAFYSPDRAAVTRLRRKLEDRTILAKMARWDPDKRWLETIAATAELKREGWRPILIARGGTEPHGLEVLRTATALGLRVADRDNSGGIPGLLTAMEETDETDVVTLRSHVDADTRRVLFRAADAVLANSVHEPFGLVGLETMAVGGIACTGCTGEDYVIPGGNALMLQTGDPREFASLYRQLRSDPLHVASMRRAGRLTARQYAWPEVVRRSLLPRLELVNGDHNGWAFGVPPAKEEAV